MRGPKRRRREETSTTGRAKQARSTQPTRSNGGGRNAPKRAAQRPPDKPPAVERPGEPPEGGRTGGTRRPPRSARGVLRHARNPTQQHTREAAARAAAAAALAGAPLATAKRACYSSRGGGRKPVGAGGPRKPRPEGNGGDGAPPLAKGAGATHGPHTEEARTTAAILLRRHAGKRDASGPPRSLAGGHRAERHKCTPDQGLHAGAKPLPYLDTIETSLTKKSG